MVGATELKQLAQRAKASMLMKKLTNEPITFEEKKIVDDYMALDMEKTMEDEEKKLFLSKALVSDTDGGQSTIVKKIVCKHSVLKFG